MIQSSKSFNGIQQKKRNKQKTIYGEVQLNRYFTQTCVQYSHQKERTKSYLLSNANIKCIKPPPPPIKEFCF